MPSKSVILNQNAKKGFQSKVSYGTKLTLWDFFHFLPEEMEESGENPFRPVSSECPEETDLFQKKPNPDMHHFTLNSSVN